MTKRKRTKYQIAGLISLSLIIAAVTYGFAQADAIGTTGLLEVGYGVQSEYQVTRISYTLDEDAPTNFLAVNFELDQAAAAVRAGVSDTKTGQILWADSCDYTGYNWACSFGAGIDVRDASWLHVE
ncbi:MAG: hypothetical protein JRI66_12890 [Deltaproteobacteria bacterium]|nr:hypothetical protein [Deltaproteobacteria bacterium]RLC99555.1 MAG: hypothetical protein DRI46_09265 [Chloroflexota bacterium]